MIYVVWAKSCSPRDTLVGYATGDQEDIAAFFADRAEYGIYLQELIVTEVGKGYAAKRKDIESKLYAIEKETALLENELKSPTGI